MRKQLNTVFELMVVPFCVLAFAVTVLGVILAVFGRGHTGQRDFIEYWSSGRLALAHKNPYDLAGLLALELPEHYSFPAHPLVMGNPPWTLPLLIPFAPMPAFPAGILWFCMSGLALFWSIGSLARLHKRRRRVLDLFGYAFAPTLVCLYVGQINLFLLLGVAGFFRFHDERPILAGACLWFCLLKPHLFLPFACVLILWIVSKRSYSTLAGILGALLASNGVAMWLDPHVWQHYSEMMRTQRLDLVNISCLSIALRQAVSPHAPWIQWLPVCAGSIWAVYFFTRHKDDWNWLEHGSLVLLVSLVVAPYTWMMDQPIAIPAVLCAVYRTRSRAALTVLALGSATIQAAALFNRVPLINGSLPGFCCVFWLGWCLFITRQRRNQSEIITAEFVEPIAANT